MIFEAIFNCQGIRFLVLLRSIIEVIDNFIDSLECEDKS